MLERYELTYAESALIEIGRAANMPMQSCTIHGWTEFLWSGNHNKDNRLSFAQNATVVVETKSGSSGEGSGSGLYGKPLFFGEKASLDSSKGWAVITKRINEFKLPTDGWQAEERIEKSDGHGSQVWRSYYVSVPGVLPHDNASVAYSTRLLPVDRFTYREDDEGYILMEQDRLTVYIAEYAQDPDAFAAWIAEQDITAYLDYGYTTTVIGYWANLPSVPSNCTIQAQDSTAVVSVSYVAAILPDEYTPRLTYTMGNWTDDARDLPPSSILGITRYEELNGEHYIDIEATEELPQGALVAFTSGIDGKLREYVVWSVKTEHQGDKAITSHRCVWSLQGMLSSATCDKMPGTSGQAATAYDALSAALSGQDAWEPPDIVPGETPTWPQTTGGASMWRMSAWEALGVLVENWGGEIEAALTPYFNDTVQTVRRQVDYRVHVGSTSPVFRYELGHGVSGITRTRGDAPQACRVIPLGSATQTDAGGNGRKIDITSVNNGVAYLEDAEAAARYADYPLAAPTVYIENSDMTTPAELKSWAQSVIKQYTQPQAEYKVDVVDAYIGNSVQYVPALGDEGHVMDSEMGWHIEARVMAVKADELARTVSATISNIEGTLGTLAKLAGGNFVSSVNTNELHSSLIAAPGNLALSAGSAQWTFGTNKAITQERTATGNVLVVKQTDIDFTTTSAATSLSTSRGTTFARMEDSTGAWLGGSELYLETNGTVSSRLFARRGNQQTGTLVSNYLQCRVDVNGNQVYAVSNPANFRSAIGITETTVTAISSILTAASGVTINSARLNRQGNFVHLCIQVKRNAATAANARFTVGTLVSGYRPKGLVVFGSAAWLGQVGSSGNIAIRNSTGASVAANTNIDIGGVWSLA